MKIYSRRLRIKRKRKRIEDQKRELSTKELEEVFKLRENRTYQDKSKEKYEEDKIENRPKVLNKGKKSEKNVNQITVWDLPKWTRRPQVFESVRYLGRIDHIEMIKDHMAKQEQK